VIRQRDDGLAVDQMRSSSNIDSGLRSFDASIHDVRIGLRGVRHAEILDVGHDDTSTVTVDKHSSLSGDPCG
jgi:hypothetical protein